MIVFLCDDIEDNVDPEHDSALFVVACDAQEAAKLWRAYYGRGELPCRVTTVPTLLLSHQCQMTPGFVVEWDKITQVVA